MLLCSGPDEYPIAVGAFAPRGAVALPRAGFGAELALSVRGPTHELKARRWRLAAMIEEAVAARLARERRDPADARPREAERLGS